MLIVESRDIRGKRRQDWVEDKERKEQDYKQHHSQEGNSCVTDVQDDEEGEWEKETQKEKLVQPKESTKKNAVGEDLTASPHPVMSQQYTQHKK